MTKRGRAPVEDLRRVAAAHESFVAAIAPLGDADVRSPSLLPGWSVGHVLTHVARNADSHVRRTEAAGRGEVVEQYPGGLAGRAAEIDAGAGRAAAELIDDVRTSAAALEVAWSEAPADAWGRITIDSLGRERPLDQLVGRRWVELEVHLVDLGIGITHRDWSDDFVAAWLPRLRAAAPARLAAGSHDLPADLDERDELAWLYGRLDRDDLPPLAPWA